MTVVVFDQAAFIDRYPEFAATIAKYPRCAVNAFAEAQIFLDNTDTSRVPVPPRDSLLNMLTAHIIALYFGINGLPPNRVVGRIASAGEGSVNVSMDMGASTSQKAWYEQTQYGASYFRASMPWRSAIYVPPADTTRVFYVGN